MTRLSSLLAIVVACACCEIVVGDPPATPPAERTAIVVDSSGIETDVRNLSFGSDIAAGFDLDPSTPRIAVTTTLLNTKNFFEIAIPLANLISIEVHGKEVEAKYLCMGQEHTVKGSLASGQFTGKSDLGVFELASDKLKQLKLNPGPATGKEEGTSPLDTTLVLLDSTKIRVGHLKWRDTDFYTDPVHRTSGNGYRFFDDFDLVRGETLTNVEFNSLSSIEFGEKDDVTVTTKDGKNVTGTLKYSPELQNPRMMKFSGICESGVFLLDPNLVKAIQFDSNSGNDSKK